jgi:biotin carboxylase
MTRSLMLLGASHFYAPVIREIQKLGAHVLVTDRNPEAEGFQYADYCEVVDITDREGSLEAAKKHRIDGVMAVNDFGVRTAAYVAGKLGLVGLSMASAVAACDKGKQRERWRQTGIPQPDFGVVSELSEAVAIADRIGFPLVMKPTDSGGASRGISVIRGLPDLEWAFNFAKGFARTGEVILEGYIEGIESTVECLIWNRHVEVLAVSDKTKEIDTKFRVAVGLHYPSFFPQEVMVQVREVVTKAIEALSLSTGAVHAEVIMRPDGRVWMVEMAARPGGGHIFHTIVPHVSGVNMVQELAKMLMGMEPDATAKYRKGAVYRFFNPPKGRIKSIRGIEEARSLEGVLALDVQVTPGTLIGDLKGQHDRAGYIVTGGMTRDEAIARADLAERAVLFDIE